jgi:hypothetical protein
MIEEVNGVDNSTNLKNTNPEKRAIHIRGGLEHNLAGYAKYYSCGSTKISRGDEFTRETNHNTIIFFRYWLADARNKLYIKLGTIA